jgi:hypothetical protein
VIPRVIDELVDATGGSRVGESSGVYRSILGKPLAGRTAYQARQLTVARVRKYVSDSGRWQAFNVTDETSWNGVDAPMILTERRYGIVFNVAAEPNIEATS